MSNRGEYALTEACVGVVGDSGMGMLLGLVSRSIVGLKDKEGSVVGEEVKGDDMAGPCEACLRVKESEKLAPGK